MFPEAEVPSVTVFFVSIAIALIAIDAFMMLGAQDNLLLVGVGVLTCDTAYRGIMQWISRGRT